MIRGTKPKTASQKMADGDTGKIGAKKLLAQINSQPVATRGLPSCPTHLKGRARAAWNFWAHELDSMDLNRRPDAMMLEGACVGYQRAVEADLILNKSGLLLTRTIVDQKTKEHITKLTAHPAVAISMSSWSQVKAFSSEFGLSPVSRTRLSSEKKNDGTEDLMKLLATPREERPVTTLPAVN